MVARKLFRGEIVQGDIRNRARVRVYACGKENIARAEELTIDYIPNLEREYAPSSYGSRHRYVIADMNLSF